MGFDQIIETGTLVLGMSALGFFVYRTVKMAFPDEKLLAAQQRLGVDGGDRVFKHWSLKYLSPFYRMLVPRIQQIKMPKYRQNKRTLFVAAGLEDQFSPDEFVGLKIISLLLTPVLVFMFMIQINKEMSTAILLACMAVGFFIPDYVIWESKKSRQKSILRELPGAMDLLTLSVEAGMDFMAAITRVVNFSRTGPLKEEWSVMLKEIQVGTTRADALRHMADRCQVSALSSLSTILIQADQMGSPIGPVLRAQSDLLRVQRFQNAEREGTKAAQKLLFPLVIFIMPSVFIVILGGPIIQALEDWM